MSGIPEELEQMFIAIEEASEQRAKELEEQEKHENIADLSPATTRPHTPLTSNSVSSRGGRRRGSVSISRFGQLQENVASGPDSPRFSSVAANMPSFQTQLGNLSQSSFNSTISDLSDEAAHAEDEAQVTQIYQIVGKQGLSKAVSNIFPRRLSRTKSANLLPPISASTDANIVVGVSIQESTVEASSVEGGEEQPREGITIATVSAPGNLASKASKRSLSISAAPGAKWLKGFTEKFRHRSRQGPVAQDVAAS